MKAAHFVHGIAIAALLTGTSQPAAAQVGDFLCSTLSIGCPPPPPPPPPPPVAAEPEPAPVVKKKRKKKRAAAPKADAAEPAAQ